MVSGAQLKALRVSAGLTQSQLAEKLGNGGYTKQVVSAVENGNRNIGINLLDDWAFACGYDVAISFNKSGTALSEEIESMSDPTFKN